MAEVSKDFVERLKKAQAEDDDSSWIDDLPENPGVPTKADETVAIGIAKPKKKPKG